MRWCVQRKKWVSSGCCSERPSAGRGGVSHGLEKLVTVVIENHGYVREDKKRHCWCSMSFLSLSISLTLSLKHTHAHYFIICQFSWGLEEMRFVVHTCAGSGRKGHREVSESAGSTHFVPLSTYLCSTQTKNWKLLFTFNTVNSMSENESFSWSLFPVSSWPYSFWPISPWRNVLISWLEAHS